MEPRFNIGADTIKTHSDAMNKFDIAALMMLIFLIPLIIGIIFYCHQRATVTFSSRDMEVTQVDQQATKKISPQVSTYFEGITDERVSDDFV